MLRLFLSFVHCILHSLQFYLCRKKKQHYNLSIIFFFQHVNSPSCLVYFSPILRTSIIGESRSLVNNYLYLLIGILSWKCNLINFFLILWSDFKTTAFALWIIDNSSINYNLKPSNNETTKYLLQYLAQTGSFKTIKMKNTLTLSVNLLMVCSFLHFYSD